MKTHNFVQESSVHLHRPMADMLNFAMHLNTPVFKFSLAIVWLVDAFEHAVWFLLTTKEIMSKETYPPPQQNKS